MIDELGDDLLNNVPYADSVTSLMELSVPIGTEEGFEVTSPFEDGVPSDPEELAEKKAFILSRESLVNAIVSEDSTETWLIPTVSRVDYEQNGNLSYSLLGDADSRHLTTIKYVKNIIQGKKSGAIFIIYNTYDYHRPLDSENPNIDIPKIPVPTSSGRSPVV